MAEDYKLIDNEAFVAGYIHKHPEWKRIVMRGIHIK